MDFSFYSNIVVTITGWTLVALLLVNGLRNHFTAFIFLTGLSSFAAAYGHSTIVNETMQDNLLLFSRMVSIWSMYYFARGTLSLFDFYSFKPAKTLNAITPIVLLIFLIIQNSFFPVMIYGVLTMALLGFVAFLLNVKKQPKVSKPMVTGILITIIAAMLFGFMNESDIFKPADYSHLLIAIALVFMAVGVKNTVLYDTKS